MKANSRLTPANTVILFSIIAAASFYYFYTVPTKQKIAYTQIYGQSVSELPFDDLTVIAKMPFLTFENKAVDLGSLKIDDNIFYVPQVKIEDEEALAEADLEALAPVEIQTPKPDYRVWAINNLQVQMISSNGVIINDNFYRVGQLIESDHVFEDGTMFEGKVQQITDKRVTVSIFDGTKVNLTLTGSVDAAGNI